VTLGELLAGSEVVAVHGPDGIEIAGVAYDSRRVRRGDVYFALPGQRLDGARFIDDAFAAGAAAAVVPAGTAVGAAAAAHTWVEVTEPRRALAECAAVVHRHPSRALTMVGITGTNGKTTTTWLLESVFRAAGWTPGVIGTTGVHLGDEHRPSVFTTPEAPELQALLAEMVARGVKAVAMEVSSHALVLRRAYGVDFDVVAFTNLSQDHLDFHGGMEAYLDAKRMLFDGRNGPRAKRGSAVVNLDDPAGASVAAAAARSGLAVLGYGEAREGTAVRIEEIGVRADGLALRLALAGGGPAALHLPLLGRYNAWNAAAAAAAALALGVPSATVVRGLAGARGVPGRLERVEAGQPFEVVVDYAHTPDALQRALAAVREHARGRVLLVFGCGGDRDRGKRAPMGRIAAARADRAIVTNDNPRGEDPAAIAAAIVSGAPAGALEVVLDRREAIARALDLARPGDVVLVAGKGHETTQTVGAESRPFDDRAVARELLAGGGRS
jgi:UDP-N-acetylmuramoyl-L-alanyl-D-glutamate--2,6-diaminopimelate ligase